MSLKIDQISLDNKVVLLRLDLDVPVADGQVIDSYRLKASLDSLKFCLKHARKTLILGHLGRPEGIDPAFSLSPVQKELKSLIQQDISLISEPERIGDWLKSDSPLGMLENLRFWSGEAENDPDFASSLAKHAQVFINDAFAVSHRISASTVGLPALLPSAIGFQFAREVESLEKAFKNPKRPVVMLLGGAKPDKLELVDNFLEFVDNLLVGGRLVLDSPDHPKIIKAKLTADTLDITPQSVDIFKNKIASAGTIIWNGPMGKFEELPHSAGTRALAEAIVVAGEPRPQRRAAYTIIGGGDTLSAIHQFGLKDNQFSHVSLAGGAMLYFLAHRTLPVLDAIM